MRVMKRAILSLVIVLVLVGLARSAGAQRFESSFDPLDCRSWNQVLIVPVPTPTGVRAFIYLENPDVTAVVRFIRVHIDPGGGLFSYVYVESMKLCRCAWDQASGVYKLSEMNEAFTDAVWAEFEEVFGLSRNKKGGK